MDPAQWDAFICHRGPDAKKTFASFLHYALDVQGIRAFFDHKMVGGTNPSNAMESAMQTATWGVVILSPKFFESKACMKELGVFLDRGNLLPVALGLEVDDIDAAMIVGKEGAVWGVHGGELWEKCVMEEAAWRKLVDRVPKEVVVVKPEDFNDCWGELINELVTNLARRLGRPVVESRVTRSTVTPPYLRNLEFLGRDNKLDELHAALLKPQSRVSISSMGGMGKTQLALEYVYRHLGEYWKVLWVDASGTSLLANYLGLAEDLGLSLEEDRGEGGGQRDREVALIRGALDRLRVPCLLIFDDVTNERQLPHLLPRLGECRVLVTTRHNLVGNFIEIRLKQLAEVDSLTLIRGSPKLGDPEFEEGLQVLAKRFDYLPLALSICSAWLRRSCLEPAALLQRLDGKQLVFAFAGLEADPIFSANPDLVALFQASIEQIKKTPMGALGERIIWVGGWFAGVSIRSELIASAAAHMAPLDDQECVGKVGDAIDVLVEYNLADRASVRGGTQAGGVVFHSILQSFGRVEGGPTPAVAMVKALVEEGVATFDTEHFQHACDLAIPPYTNPKIQLDAADTEGAVNKILLPLVSHYRQQGLYFKARNAISGVDVEDLPAELQGRYLDCWASILYDCGQYAEAMPLYKRSLGILEKALGPVDPLVVTTLNGMAGLLTSQGKYEEALRLYDRSLHILSLLGVAEEPLVATILGGKGLVMSRLGKDKEALQIYYRSLRIQEKRLPQDHLDVATTLGSIAGLQRKQGKYGEAMRLYERSRLIKENALGPMNPEIATTLGGIALLLKSQGKYEDALPLFEKSLSIKEKALGPEHLSVARTLHNMAGLLESQGKYEEALQLCERSLSIKEKALGLENPLLVNTLEKMAGVLRRLGKYAKAQSLHKRSLRIRKKKALGQNHPSAAATLNNMAGLLRSQGKYEEALPLYERSMRITEKVLGPELPNVLDNHARPPFQRGLHMPHQDFFGEGRRIIPPRPADSRPGLRSLYGLRRLVARLPFQVLPVSKGPPALLAKTSRFQGTQVAPPRSSFC
jgi:tetratricopeptide (TPR) repeat protein